MAKRDQKDVQNKLYQTSDSINRNFGNFQNQLKTPITETWNRGTNDYNDARSGYANFQQTGGLTPEDMERLRKSYGGIGGGGVSNPLAGQASAYAALNSAYANAYRPEYAESDAGFRRLSDASGGFNTNELNQIYGNVKNLSDIGKTGGITTQDYNNINRASLLDFEKTGGYSDLDKQKIMAKASSSSPAYFGAMKDEIDRNRRITGNLAGATATNFKLAREAAKQQSADRLNADIGLAESVRGGRMDAAKFLADANYNLTGLRTSNQLQGSQAAGNLGLGTQQAITSNQLAGLRGLQDSQTNLGNWGLQQAGGLDQFGLSKAGGLDSWNLNNAQMDMAAQQSNAASSRAAAQAQAEMERWAIEYGNANKQWGTEGLADLYKTNLGAHQGYMGMSLDGLNSQYGNQANILGLAAQNRGRTAMENMGQIAGAVGGGIGSLVGMGGFGIGGGNQNAMQWMGNATQPYLRY